MLQGFQIAIDGPVGSGKTTVASILAKKLGLLFVDTGATYRAAALLAKKKGVSWKDEKGIIKLLGKSKIDLKRPGVRVFLDGEDVSKEIREEEIGWGASVIAVLPGVRKELVKLQRRIAEGKKVVMEGRDIGTVVLPEADLKIYLDGEQRERAQRKYQERTGKGEEISCAEVFEEIKKRDRQDMGREVDPLRKTKESAVVDTTNLDIEGVVEEIMRMVKEKMRGGGE